MWVHPGRWRHTRQATLGEGIVPTRQEATLSTYAALAKFYRHAGVMRSQAELADYFVRKGFLKKLHCIEAFAKVDRVNYVDVSIPALLAYMVLSFHKSNRPFSACIGMHPFLEAFCPSLQHILHLLHISMWCIHMRCIHIPRKCNTYA